MMRQRLLVGLGLVGLIAGLLTIFPPDSASAAQTPPNMKKREAIRELVRNKWYSTGARLWAKSPEPTLNAQRHRDRRFPIRFGRNSDANDPSRDLFRGQVESAIGAIQGPNQQERLVVGWIDVNGFFSPDPTSPDAAPTHIAFSRDGGKTFDDLGGLVNDDPQMQWSGDPSVVAIDANHFIVGSLYLPSALACADPSDVAPFALGVSVLEIDETGTVFTNLNPLIAASGGDFCAWLFDETGAVPYPDFLDKPFLSYDPTTRTLAMSYTNFFGDEFLALGQIELVRAPVPAEPGLLAEADFSDPVVVWESEPACGESDASSEALRCGAVNQGSYPVVTPDGTTYVAWERNWLSNIFFNNDPCVYLHVAAVPLAASTPSLGGIDDARLISLGQSNPCNGEGGVASIDGVTIPGYSRELGQDFPRIAYNPVSDHILFVWNDASEHAFGDIYLRDVSRDLATWSPIVRVNSRPNGGLKFMPSLSVGSDGSIRTGWFDRRRAGATKTDYAADIRRTLLADSADVPVSTQSTNWLATGSLIGPNFGDYTDAATIGTKSFWTWTDGRLGFPQPFVGWR